MGTSETVKCVGKSEDFPKRKNLHQSLELNHFEREGGRGEMFWGVQIQWRKIF